MMWDAVVIGSGFGGSMVAHELVHAGHRVLMLERGGWVARGPDNWGPGGVGLATSHFSRESAFEVRGAGPARLAGLWQCVGGQSVFYGGASFRFRERDFDERTEGSGAGWPICYADLEPYYSRAEAMLGVAGEAGTDPTEPPRSRPYPQQPAPLASSSRLIVDAAQRLGMRPFRIPLAIAYPAGAAGRACTNCGTCDGYACAAEAKNDLATSVIPGLIRAGMVLRTNTVCVQLVNDGKRVVAAEYVDRVTGERGRVHARSFILAAGALASPHLILASGLDAFSPARVAVGRYLTRHRNVVVVGVFAHRPNPEHSFDKQVAIHDFYFAESVEGEPVRTLGGIQQLTPSRGLVRAYLPRGLREPAAMVMARACGLLVIAEDEPRVENGVTIRGSVVDRFGLPRLVVQHSYSREDEAATALLVRPAKAILREAGALFTITYPIATFSHALGTVRMGCNPRSSPLDADGRFRGMENLYVSDGSALPRSAGVNPSLTIAANALRVGDAIAAEARVRRRTSRVLPVLTPFRMHGGR